MTAHELIQQLQTLPPETEVFVWCDDRYPVNDTDPIDPTFLEQYQFVDINLGEP